ncbi:hypothetical protein C8R44DRAFT_752793 [Mycena epipterygia]|nr:hypothetical protein C8R44DRAFT_752793 [Mycena epipterygia]
MSRRIFNPNASVPSSPTIVYDAAPQPLSPPISSHSAPTPSPPPPPVGAESPPRGQSPAVSRFLPPLRHISMSPLLPSRQRTSTVFTMSSGTVSGHTISPRDDTYNLSPSPLFPWLTDTIFVYPKPGAPGATAGNCHNSRNPTATVMVDHRSPFSAGRQKLGWVITLTDHVLMSADLCAYSLKPL